jgi:hypothetical protein
MRAGAAVTGARRNERMTDEEMLVLLRREVREVNGRVLLDCETALALATKYGLAPGDVGRLCNEKGIRITACQLGCFP